MTISLASIVLNMIAFGATIIILMLSAFSANLKQRVNFLFFLNMVCFFISFLTDILLTVMEGHSGMFLGVAMRITSCLCNLAYNFQIIVFVWYLYEYLHLKTDVSKRSFTLLTVVGVAMVLMSLITSPTNLFVRLDEYGNYIYQPTFLWLNIAYVMIAFIYLGIVLQYIKVLTIQEGVSLISYVVMPVICNIISVTVPDMYIDPVGVAVTFTLIYINLQVELMHKMQRKDLELTEARISVMLSQIQPHFLYNSLASIEYLCVVDGSEQAAIAVRDFSKYLRGNMDSLTYKSLIPFEKELQHANLYLSLENRRFGDLIQTKYDTSVTAFVLPPLTLQPIVENAVRHGVTKREAGGLITIRTEEDNAFWRIIVVDDGVGFNPDEQKEDGRTHIGIANVCSRLKMLCDGQLIIESTLGIGTTATILIPKNKNSKKTGDAFS